MFIRTIEIQEKPRRCFEIAELVKGENQGGRAVLATCTNIEDANRIKEALEHYEKWKKLPNQGESERLPVEQGE